MNTEEKEVIIFNPVYSPKMLSESMTILGRDLLEVASKRNDVIFRVLNPSANSKYKESFKDVLGELPNIEYVDVDFDDFTELPLGYANKSFKVLQNFMDYYVVLNIQTSASFGIQRIATKTFNFFSPEIINWMVAGDVKEPHLKLHKSTMEEVVGSLAYFHNIFNSTWSYKRFLEVARSMYSGSKMQEIMSKSKVIPLGVNVSKLSKYPHEESDDFVFLYGGRPASHKRLDIMVDTVGKLVSVGKRVTLKLHLTTVRASLASYNKIQKGEFVKEVFDNPQESFYNSARTAKAFIVTSEAESYGLAFKEMIALGLVGIVLERAWTKELWWSDYPFIAKDKDELFSMAKYVVDNYDEAKELMKPFIEDIVKNHDSEKNMNLVIDECVKLSKSIKYGKDI